MEINLERFKKIMRKCFSDQTYESTQIAGYVRGFQDHHVDAMMEALEKGLHAEGRVQVEEALAECRKWEMIDDELADLLKM